MSLLLPADSKERLHRHNKMIGAHRRPRDGNYADVDEGAASTMTPTPASPSDKVFACILFFPLQHLIWLFVAGLLLLLHPPAEHLDCFTKHPATQKENVCLR